MDIFGFAAAKELLELQIANPAAATKLIVKKAAISSAFNVVTTAGIALAAQVKAKRQAANDPSETITNE